uniref:Baseplate hub n=1 Tax=Pseudomonas phage Cygsa01 TaxID=3138529 RepID=A0AAU6W3W1_9VIRU
MSEMVQPSEYDLDYVTIKAHDSTTVNLKVLFQELNIYTSLFGKPMSAAILLTDANNLPHNLPILGGEDVEIRYRTAGRQEYKVLKFKVSSVGERMPIKGEALAYWLNLVTPESYIDASTCVSQAFDGMYSDLVKKIPAMLGSDKPVDVSPSVGLAKFISPQWSPLKIAGFMAGRATDMENSPFYFWEDTNGFHFKSLAALYAQESTREYFYEPNDQMNDRGQRDMVKKFLNVERMEITKSNDKLKQNQSGMFEQDLVTFDLRSKNVTNQSCKASNAGVDKFAPFDDMAGKRTKVGFTLTKPDQSHVSLFQRTASRHFLGNTKILAVVAGDDEITNGQIVDFKLPSHEPQGGEKLKEDRLLSGRWLITGMKQTFSKQQYKMALEFSKDSFGSDPTATAQ